MFNNIGEKIKIVAIITLILGSIISIILGLSMIAISCQEYVQDDTAFSTGITLLISGPIVSWLGSLTTYGLGYLIEVSEENNRLLVNTQHKLAKTDTHPTIFYEAEIVPDNNVTPDGKVRCPACSELYSVNDRCCPYCGHSLK